MANPTDPSSQVCAPGQPDAAPADTLESLTTEFQTKCPEPTLAAYAPEIAAATVKLVVEADGPQVVTPRQFLWVKGAVIWRETRAGNAQGMVPRGPAGSGDWTARAGPKWCAIPNGKLITSLADLPQGWNAARTKVMVDGKPTYPLHSFPWVIPVDEKGWGRGLGQGDAASNWPFIQRVGDDGVPLWQVAGPSILWTAGILLGHLNHFPGNFGAGVAAYNNGDGSEEFALAHSEGVDGLTTGGNYSHEVLTNAAAWSGLSELAPKAA